MSEDIYVDIIHESRAQNLSKDVLCCVVLGTTREGYTLVDFLNEYGHVPIEKFIVLKDDEGGSKDDE